MMDLTQLGIQPISAEQPGGSEAKYDPAFEQLQSEIDKLSIPSAAGNSTDWNKVVQLGSLILAEKSKDLKAASYLVTGLMQLQQVEGLSTGLAIVKDLIDNFWQDLFPPLGRIRGRVAAVEYLFERVSAFIESYTPEPLTAEQLQTIVARVDALDQTLTEKLTDGPSFAVLSARIGRWPVQAGPGASQEQNASQPDQQPPQPIAPQTARMPSPNSAPIDEADAGDLVKTGLRHLVNASDRLLEKNLADPLAFRLNRIGAWLTVDQLPLADGERTRLPAPDAAVRSAIEGAFRAGNFETAVSLAEARVRQFLFWLDLSRLSAQSLQNLGGKYQAACDAICSETAGLVRRLPGLEKLAFEDGTPFADQQTRIWLDDISPKPDGPASLPADRWDEAEAEVEKAYSEAQELVKKRKLTQAVTVLQERLSTSSAGKTGMLWRMALVRLLLGAGQNSLVKPQLDEMLRQLDEFRLEQWEPGFALRVLQVVHRGWSASDQEIERQNAGAILERIARNHPAIALAMSG